MNTSLLPYIKLTKERTDEVCSIMCDGNILLEKWHQKYNNSVNKPKLKIKKRINFINFIYKKARKKSKDILLLDFTIPEHQVAKMFAVKEIEYEILCGYAGFIAKRARKYYMTHKDVSNISCNTFEDYYNECILYAQEAIFGYMGTNKFITYLGKILHNNTMRFINKSNFFNPHTNECVRLRMQFEKFKNNNPNLTVDEVLGLMEISQEEINLLLSSYISIAKYANFGSQNSGSKNNHGYEYGSYEETIFKFADKESTNDEHHVSPSILDKEKFMDWSVFSVLTDIEKEVIYNYCMDQNNWRKNTKLCNPSTGKKYTRWGLSIIFSRAIAKLQNEFKKNKSEKRGDCALSA